LRWRYRNGDGDEKEDGDFKRVETELKVKENGDRE
jgi:hypothetical protein